MPTAILAKSRQVLELARLILGHGAAAQDIEDLAYALMYVPSVELASMHATLAATGRTRRTAIAKKR